MWSILSGEGVEEDEGVEEESLSVANERDGTACRQT